MREAAQKHGAKARGGMREHRKTRKLREYARELREHALDGEGGVAREGRERGAAHGRKCGGQARRKCGGQEGAQHAERAQIRRKARGKHVARAGTHKGKRRGEGRSAQRCECDVCPALEIFCLILLEIR